MKKKSLSVQSEFDQFSQAFISEPRKRLLLNNYMCSKSGHLLQLGTPEKLSNLGAWKALWSHPPGSKLSLLLKNYLHSLTEMIDLKKKKRLGRFPQNPDIYLLLGCATFYFSGLQSDKNPLKGLFHHTTVTSFTSQAQAQGKNDPHLLLALEPQCCQCSSFSTHGCDLQNQNIWHCWDFREGEVLFFKYYSNIFHIQQ